MCLKRNMSVFLLRQCSVCRYWAAVETGGNGISTTTGTLNYSGWKCIWVCGYCFLTSLQITAPQSSRNNQENVFNKGHRFNPIQGTLSVDWGWKVFTFKPTPLYSVVFLLVWLVGWCGLLVYFNSISPINYTVQFSVIAYLVYLLYINNATSLQKPVPKDSGFGRLDSEGATFKKGCWRLGNLFSNLQKKQKKTKHAFYTRTPIFRLLQPLKKYFFSNRAPFAPSLNKRIIL